MTIRSIRSKFRPRKGAAVAKVRLLWAICFFLSLQSLVLGQTGLARLTQDQKLAEFQVKHLYSNSDGTIVAAKFTHVPTGAPVFLLQLETIPQLLTWVDGPVDSDRGLAHSLEHLLIVKGSKGRYLNLLKQMHLGLGNAATFGDRVCYGLSSRGGIDNFFEQVHALLDALYRPDFTDAEAEREFYHFSVATADKKKTLIESGTVYDEQLSNEDRYKYYYELYKSLLGSDNPFGFNSGGEPDAMRGVTPQEIRRFHDKYYRIGPGTGFIFSFPRIENVPSLLRRISQELQQVSKDSGPERVFSTGSKYPIHASQSLTPSIYPFPAPREADPGTVAFGWAPTRNTNRSLVELRMLDLFVHCLASGEDSVLYKELVDSRTRVINSGATGIESDIFIGNSPFFPVIVTEVSGIPGNQISIDTVEKLRSAISQHVKEIFNYADQSTGLTEFNQLAASYAENLRRSESVWAKNPPGFDSVPPKTEWKEYFERLEMDPSFIRSLSRDREWEIIEEQLTSGKNVWRKIIDDFRLLDMPHATAALPSPQLMAERTAKKKQRTELKAKSLMAHYHTNDEQQALSRFEQEENEKAKAIDAIDASVPHPHFTDQPPLTPDDEIRYTQFKIEEVPVIASLFDQPPTIDIGLSFDLRKVPRRYYKYLPIFPRCLDSLGLKIGGQVTSYAAMSSRIQKDVFAFSASNEFNAVSHRADLTIRASATSIEKFQSALALIQDVINHSYLDPGNASRLRDIVAGRISDDNLYPKQDASITNAGYSFRYQGDPLYIALYSRFVGEHLDNRLKWLLHEPVSPADILSLESFASNFLLSLPEATRQDVAKKLVALNVTGVEKELVTYWNENLLAFPETELIAGLRRLAAEVEEDLRVGPVKTIAEMRKLQNIILSRGALHVDLTLSQPILDKIRPGLTAFLRSIPNNVPDPQSAEGLDNTVHPLTASLEQRYGLPQQYSARYVGFVNPSRGGDVIFSADFPNYTQLDQKVLRREIASTLLSGAGPQSFQIKTLARGLAYHNIVWSFPAFRRIWYYADRIPDVPSLLTFVNETASTVSDLRDQTLVDYALSNVFSYSRSGFSPSDRGRAIAQDIRDGNDPETIRRYSEAILTLRKDPDLLSELTHDGLSAICPVLLRDDCKQEQQEHGSLFFFQGSEQVLSDIEKRLPIPKLLKLYPSDFWINY
jgi:hypothetical protein